jgi:shikimate kinase
MNKVVLMGYMGSGKSIIAKKLANNLKIPCLELDKLIEEKSKMTIETIFLKKGELFFRKLEHELFLENMLSDKNFVLSTGGGTPCYYNHHELLKNSNSDTIYLKASVDTLFDRLIKESSKRPLIASLSKEELKEFIAKHLFERSYYYSQAKYIINVDSKTIDEVVTEIEEVLA